MQCSFYVRILDILEQEYLVDAEKATKISRNQPEMKQKDEISLHKLISQRFPSMFTVKFRNMFAKKFSSLEKSSTNKLASLELFLLFKLLLPVQGTFTHMIVYTKEQRMRISTKIS